MAMDTNNKEFDSSFDKIPGNIRLLEKLASKLGLNANATLIYGNPVDREGVTVIPVAKVSYGFGGGEGNANPKEKDSQGSGGGGAITVKPAGYIEIKNGKATYRPIVEPLAIIRTVFFFVFLILWVGLRQQKRINDQISASETIANAAEASAKRPRNISQGLNLSLVNVNNLPTTTVNQPGKKGEQQPAALETED
jgi:uncharacterized spore protein YtfJ